MRAELVAIHRGISRHSPGPLVIVNDQEIAGVFKELVQTADDDDIDVEKQGSAAQAVEVCGERGEFGPAAFGNAGRKVERRDRDSTRRPNECRGCRR